MEEFKLVVMGINLGIFFGIWKKNLYAGLWMAYLYFIIIDKILN